jgi:membrane protein DedA with SNARE-associated domain
MTDERTASPSPSRTAPSGPPPAAIGSLLLAVVVGAGAWYWFGRAADAGVRRLERLDTMRAYCE